MTCWKDAHRALYTAAEVLATYGSNNNGEPSTIGRSCGAIPLTIHFGIFLSRILDSRYAPFQDSSMSSRNSVQANENSSELAPASFGR